MLKKVVGKDELSGARIDIAHASFPAPFASGLEYAAPARGTWNIVHTGMLIPEVHEIFVCAAGCLRGVVLTAAEMGASERFSTVEIRENNVIEGNMEELLIDGVTDILQRLPQVPPAVLVYTSCIHHFMGTDLGLAYRTLGERFPNVEFTDCYMTPTMRKSGLTPDQIMRKQLYSLLTPVAREEKSVNIIGNDFATDETSELVRLIRESGWTLRDITLCRTYAEYKKMAGSSVNISYAPAAMAGGEELKKRLGQEHMYLPLSYGYDEIERNLWALSERLGVEKRDYTREKENADAALKKALEVVGEAPVEIDYTVTPRPLGLARLLLEHGFNVTRLYVDSITAEEKDDFEKLKRAYPDLELNATVHAEMRVTKRVRGEKTLAIGQKAAYFTGTPYFVNVVEGGGMYGFDGIGRMARLIAEAFSEKKDMRGLIQIKGLGCGCMI